MKEYFEVTGGSAAGRDHRVSGKNNHDAFSYQQEEDFSVGFVCDGCGSSKHSEVGAKLGSRLILQAAAQQTRRFLRQSYSLADPEKITPIWERVRQDVLANLRVLANQMGNSLSEMVTDYFLFTTVGFVITRYDAMFVSIGDGIFVVNGEITQIGPFPDNTPPYLGYGLVDTALMATPELLQFQVHRLLPTNELHSFLIGSDGVTDILKANGRNLPGKTEPVGSLSQFWENDRYFGNPDSVNRRLRLINQDSQKPDWSAQRITPIVGLLPDDTTLITGRRKRQEETP